MNDEPIIGERTINPSRVNPLTSDASAVQTEHRRVGASVLLQTKEET